LLIIHEKIPVAKSTRHTKFLDEHVFESSKNTREARLMMEKEYGTEVVKEFNSIWRLYFSVFTGKAVKRLQGRSQQLAAQKFRIMNKADAEVALKTWFGAELPNSLFSQLFHAKFEQLVALEKGVGDDVASSALATIEPDSFFATTLARVDKALAA
jgi:hypothetical protein